MIPLYTNDQVPWNLVVVFFALSAATAPFEIINHRYGARLPTVISSERGESRLREFDEATTGRIIERASRLGDYLVYLPIGTGANQRIRR